MKLVVLAVAIAACSRAHDDHPATPPTPPTPHTPPSQAPGPPPTPVRGACTLQPLPLRHPAPKRLVAIGDLHGDLGGMRAALRTAGAIDDHDAWIGKDLVVVQTGDILDRGDDERQMLDLVARLEREAIAAGGQLIALVGNHELMNAAGDFRYVTPGGFTAFDGAAGSGSGAQTSSQPAVPPEVPGRARSRFAALEPGGVYAKQIAHHDVIAIVGDTVFSHAGVLGDWVHHVDEANQSARCWLDGQSGSFTEAPAVLTSDDSPVWTRVAGIDSIDCTQLAASLSALGVKRMVVGHTVQSHVNALCDGALWRIDVGLAKEYGGPIEVLQIYPEAKVLSGKR